LNILNADPSRLRTLAALLAMPADDALEALRDMQQQAPWLESCLAEIEQLPLDHWQAEHTRLFVSAYPKVPCPPYESAYRHGAMGGASAVDLSDLYRRAGLRATDMPPDYLGTMLECAAYLMEQGLDELLGELADEHFGLWVHRFAGDLQEASELRLYRRLGRQIGNLLPEPTDRE
jgi:TorA maturation chaperone TorD